MDLIDLLLIGAAFYLYKEVYGETNSDVMTSSNSNNSIPTNTLPQNFPNWVAQNNQTKLNDSRVKRELANKAQEIINKAFTRFSVVLYVNEAYRTQERQNKLYAQGRTTAGQIVTWTRNSNHTKGEAVDLVPIINGKPSWSENFNWNIIGNLANEVGLKWGGSFGDKPHIELK